jgi:uncharacterized protein YggU (UPF0235/DUF167 family)
MARVTVRVHPRARRTGVSGRLGEAWKLDLAAPPVEGRANDACIRFFAGLAGVPQARVRIVTGLSSRTKVVEVEGVTEAALAALLDRRE